MATALRIFAYLSGKKDLMILTDGLFLGAGAVSVGRGLMAPNLTETEIRKGQLNIPDRESRIVTSCK